MRQVEAYNRRDLEAFLATYAPDNRWYQFPDAHGGSGREAMGAIFKQLFATAPNRNAEVRRSIVRGHYVILEEYVTGLPTGAPLAAVVIHEVWGEMITRVGFLP